MPPRHPLPRQWLMTDARAGAALWSALERLPRGAGVVARPYGLEPAATRAFLARVAQVARRRRLVLVVAGPHRVRGQAGTHKRRGAGLITWPAHDRRQAIAAVRAGAHAVFVSPVFATRSHPDARQLGPIRAAALARALPVSAIALGGMDARRFRRLCGFHGWAGIDAWTADQKRNAVPT
jgi:thiamine-phosphate pyrophosphorylase